MHRGVALHIPRATFALCAACLGRSSYLSLERQGSEGMDPGPRPLLDRNAGKGGYGMFHSFVGTRVLVDKPGS